MAELILELFSEEIPARMQRPAAEQLLRLFEESMKAENLHYSKAHTFVTPRRLTLNASDVSLTQESSASERRGPRTDAPDQAIEGFLRSTGLTKDQLTTKTTDKGEFYFAIIKQTSRNTSETLTQMLQDILQRFSWPKSMRWGSNEMRWVRPLKNICCVFGGEILPITFGHLTANDQSYGHRFLAPDAFTVKDFANYQAELTKRKVVLDSSQRESAILTEAEKIAKGKGLTIVPDNALLEEIAGLVEWPVALLGTIADDLMQVPEEVLISSIRTHQKYLCLRHTEGNLAPHFIVVSNMETGDGGKQVIAGNERVLRARLSDAKFFWQQDLKDPLDGREEALDRIVFHANLGTVKDKTERIAAIAAFAAVWIPHADLKHIERAAALCKADLVTEMVGEFPELQGVMGMHYATALAEPNEVALAMKEHYAPAGPRDNVPTHPVSIAVALADKIDSLVGLFAIDETPTGSKDPYALRRAALGIIRIILENKLSIPLRVLITHAIKQYPGTLLKFGHIDPADKSNKLNKKPSDIADSLLHFFGERLKALLKAENVRHDLIAAVFDDGAEDDLLRLVQRVASLHNFLQSDDGENMLAAYRRASNIVSIEEKKDDTHYKGSPSKSLLDLDEEQTLHDAMQKAEKTIKAALKKNDYEAALLPIAALRPLVDEFFEHVTVNADDADLRKNRLKLLAQLRNLVDEIANFELIEG